MQRLDSPSYYGTNKGDASTARGPNVLRRENNGDTAINERCFGARDEASAAKASQCIE